MNRTNGTLPEKTIYHLDQINDCAGENAKKKTKKWSLGALFRRRRNKSSDTDSSSETDNKKKGFLTRSHKHKGGCRRVIGKFETKIIKNAEKSNDCVSNRIEKYEASPTVIKRKYNIILPDAISQSNQKITDRMNSLESFQGSCGSLDTASRRNLVKARAEARRVRLGEDSSSSEDCCSSKTSTGSSLQRNHEQLMKNGSSSLSKKSRAARTDRYIKRHYREDEGRCCSNMELSCVPQALITVGSSKNRWVPKIINHQNCNYTTPYTARTQSATSSPVSSPITHSRNVYCSSLPNKSTGTMNQNERLFGVLNCSSGTKILQPSIESLPKMSPPPPPPRNLSRKITYPTDMPMNRPLSYAFDSNAKPKDIISFVQNSRSAGYTNEDNARTLRHKSNSDMELCVNDRFLKNRQLEIRLDNIQNSHLKERCVQKYCADRKPRSRNPIQLVKENENVTLNLKTDSIAEMPSIPCNSQVLNSGYVQTCNTNELPLSKANEIGIPVINDSKIINHRLVSPFHNNFKPDGVQDRPLSVVSEKSDNELLNDTCLKKSSNVFKNKNLQKPKNLEEALMELEEIYKSLKLSDEDLLDRADRRDLQSALRMNPNFSRHSWNDLENTDEPDGLKKSSSEYLDLRLLSPRLTKSRRAARPDMVADDMAYRKLNKKDNQDTKSTSNVVSQSGSFLLVSPALSPPPLTDISPVLVQINKEPDITLDDVVFRNIRQANNTLKILDPQPPFGIPLGPISSAPNSDYLHALPGEKYRSTFNPSRTPDIVKDDLAFRNLRKDIRGSLDITKQYILPSAVAKKRRAIRSLSANVVSLMNKYDYCSDEDGFVDVNGNSLKKSNRCVSYNDLPDVLEDYKAQKRALIRNCDECLNIQKPVECKRGDDDHTFDLIADEAKMLSMELRRKLHELEVIPLNNKQKKLQDLKSNTCDKEVFIKRLSIHKPVTLSQFKINENCKQDEGKAGQMHLNTEQVQSQANEKQFSEKIETDSNTDKLVSNDECKNSSFGLKHLCQNLNWNSLKIVCAQYQPKQAILNEGECDCNNQKMNNLRVLHNDAPLKTEIENSSSGVSSTSETPDSSGKCETSPTDNFCSGVYKSFPIDIPSSVQQIKENSRAKEVYLDQNVFPSFESVSEQFSKELNHDPTLLWSTSANYNSMSYSSNGIVVNGETKPKKHCSRVEITLSTPEPAGVVNNTFNRWSLIETKDAAIMTEEFEMNRDDGNICKMKKMNDDAYQSRVCRYKEERKKQLASQFANLVYNRDNSSSSSSTNVNFKKTTFKLHNCNSAQDEDPRRPKILNSYKSPNKIRYKEDSSDDMNEHKRKSNGSLTSDSSSINSSTNNRDKSAKRKSYLNRSVNSEKPSNINHSHNQRSHFNCSADEKNHKKLNNRITVPSALPVPVAANSTSVSTSSSFVSSHKANPSPNHRRKLAFVNSKISSDSTCNGFAQSHLPNSPDLSSLIYKSKESGLDEIRPKTNDKDLCDKSRIPRRMVSPSTFSIGNEANYKKSSDLIRQQVVDQSHVNKSPLSQYDESFSDTRFDSSETGFYSSQKTTLSNKEKLIAQKNSLFETGQNFSQKDCPYNNQRMSDECSSSKDQNFDMESFEYLSKRSQYSINSETEHFHSQDRIDLSSSQNLSLDIIEEYSAPKPSILKKKFDERSISLDTQKPNSILKRKTFEDVSGNSFQNINAYRQGILKKHSSLDEAEIRQRSCSPDVSEYKFQEFKPILKSHRRSSLEDLVHNRSSELHSILKRSKPNNEDNSDNSTSPHGILKRKAFNIKGHCDRLSFDSFSSRDTFSEVDAIVKPILKNKQTSLEMTTAEKNNIDIPRPILKKKQSTENDTDEEKPKKPILKINRKSLEEEMANFSLQDTSNGEIKFDETKINDNRNIKPILKKNNIYYMDTRNVKSDDDTIMNNSHEIQNRIKRHSLPGPGVLIRRSFCSSVETECSLSTVDNMQNLENFLQEQFKIQTEKNTQKMYVTSPPSDKHNIRKNFRSEKNPERYKTQPVTQNEINSTQSLQERKHYFAERTIATNMETRNENDKQPACSSEVNTEFSDSLNQNRLTDEQIDEKDVINKLKRSNSVSMKASLFSQLERDSKKAAEESKMKKRNENINRRKLKVKCSDLGSRFATQPVTWEEVAEAKKQNLSSRNKITDIKNEIYESMPKTEAAGNEDSAYLPISERVKIFTKKMESQYISSRVSRRPCSRFKTQPVTAEELEVAKRFTSISSQYISENANPPTLERVQKLPWLSNIDKFTLSEAFISDIRADSSETGSQSEGDTSSSGGREIQSIIGGNYYQCRTNNKSNKDNRITNMHFGTVVTENADVVDECPVINGSSSIAQRLAALQKSGQLDWKKRISRFAPENEVSPILNINETQDTLKKELTNGFRCKISEDVHIDDKMDNSLAERLEKLENARQTWKKRVEPSDAVKFSVAGKMASTLSTIPKLLPVTSPHVERKKRGPCPSRFRSFREQRRDTHTNQTTVEKSKSSSSVYKCNPLQSDAPDEDVDVSSKIEKNNFIVNVPQIFDEEFSTFFGKMESVSNGTNMAELSTDFSGIKIEGPRLLPVHKKIKAQRKHPTSGNPLKTLATKIEIKNEYKEVKTNVAEREVKRLNVEKLSKNSSLAVEVLAGLASKEDFQAVQLKKAAPVSSPMLPYKPLMLLHIKGRRYVQTRLVKPVVKSVNSGDCYVLVTSKEVYHWIGQFANIIEKSRGAEIAQHIVGTHDLGCSFATHVITVVEDSSKPNSKPAQNFWMLLGATADEAISLKAVDAGHPDEDEIYESSLVSTNMFYDVRENELIPLEKYWALVPKIQMLDPNKVLIFDFGSELYVWMGKNVDMKLRKSSVKLAKELWENGFNYEECDLCPITSANTVGNREANNEEVNVKRDIRRPDWCLFAKVTQHMETVLFREKFLDWPDFSRIIRAKGKDEDTEKHTDGRIEINPCDVKEILDRKFVEVDLILEGSHLGRGAKYFDEDRKRFCIISTLDVQMWHIAEFDCEEVPPASLGQFYSSDSYIVKWFYSISYTGRELSGQPSKHTTVGRDRYAYFLWQGKSAPLNEQGAAAMLIVELDKEKTIQLRICQGYEPPAFYNLFGGRMVIYKNKLKENAKIVKNWRLFICRGEIESEAALLEVSCNIKQLRSRASFVLVNITTGVTYIWNGCKVTKEAVKVCQSVVKQLSDQPPPELGLYSGIKISIIEISEGNEPKEFFTGLGGSSKKLYISLINDSKEFKVTPILYNLSSNSGIFCATSIWSPCRHKGVVTAFPFLQEDLYSASQPALFLMDTGYELWLWQGWWPEREKLILENDTCTTNVEEMNHRGSASVRWQAERRAAMQTALDYWKHKYTDEPVRAFLVWAGLEPVLFTNLFPDWEDRDDIAEMNILDGRKPGEVLDVEQELERLTQSRYPIEQLLQRPLPDGVDPTKLELYLSPSHFVEILKVTKEEFATLPSWKQTNLKKNAGLF